MHGKGDIGRRKVDSATHKLKRLNPGVKGEATEEMITEANISQLVGGFDLIVDAMDDLPTRFLLNKVAIEKDVPFFRGAVHGFEGRVMTIMPGETACLRCVYRGSLPRRSPRSLGLHQRLSVAFRQ